MLHASSLLQVFLCCFSSWTCDSDSGATLVIRDNDTGQEVAQIIHSADMEGTGNEVAYDEVEGVEDGQMTIHIAEDVMQDSDALGQVGIALPIDLAPILGMDLIPAFRNCSLLLQVVISGQEDPHHHQQHVTIVSQDGETISFGETVEVPGSDAGVVLSEVGGEMVMADGTPVGDVQVRGAAVLHPL